VLVRRIDDRSCPRCGAAVGIGLKEEPTGWKVYRVCQAAERSCSTVRVGTVPREAVSHADDVVERAEALL